VAENHYVSTTGSATWEQSTNISTPCSITTAGHSAVAGDTVYVRAGTYTSNCGHSATLHVSNSGTSGSRIVFRPYQSEAVYLSGVYFGVWIVGDYVTIDGLVIDGALTEPNVVACHIVTQGNYVIIQNCTIKNMGSSDNQHAVWLQDHNTYNQILDCYFENIGGYSPPDGDDWGDGVRIEHSDAHHNLIQGCTFDRTGSNASCGHAAIDMWGHHNVFRDNTCNHCVMGCAGNLTNDAYNVFDNNIANDVSYTIIGGFPYEATGTAGRKTIWRRNRVYVAIGTGIHIWGDANRDSSYSHIYNNVFYDCGNANVNEWRKGAMFQNLNSEAFFEGIVFKNNIFRSNVEDGIQYKNTTAGDHFISDNHFQASDPLFTDEGTFDFTLQSGSPCRNAGAWLTTTNGTGDASTTLIVDDAAYFYDGFGITTGDTIQLEGQTARVNISSIDYATHTLTLAAPLTWGDGVGVALAYDGTAPDQGAYEYEEFEDPEINITDGTNQIPNAGTFAYGSKSVGTNTDRVFTLASLSAAPLTLSGTPIIVITGTNADQFSVQAQPTTPIAGGTHVHFTLRFSPTSSGAKTAAIAIGNNDTDENPYNINLTGTGTETGLGVTYYVDYTAGNDGFSGLTPDLAWKTIAKVNAASLSPGDSVLFKRGETWREQLTVPSSGSAGSPITFGAYGTGDDPKIYGSTQVSGWDQDDIPGEWGDLSAESFEGTGYEESWSETITGDTVIDEDSTDVTPPTGGGSQVLKIQSVTVDDAAQTRRAFTADQPVTYTRCYVRIAAEGVSAVASADLYSTQNAAFSLPFAIQLYKDGSSNLYLRLKLYNNGAFAYYNSDNIANLNQWYLIEVKYDYTGATWYWKIDDVSQDSGSLTGTYRTGPRYWYLGPKTVVYTMTAYYDLFAISTTGEIGAGTELPANCWKAALSGTPKMAWFYEGSTVTRGNTETVLANVNAKYDYYYTLGYLVTYSLTDPDSAYTSIEAGVRSWGIDGNDKSYLTIQYFEILHSGIGIQLDGTHCLAEHNYIHHGMMITNTVTPTTDDYGCQAVSLKNTDNEVSYNRIENMLVPCYDYNWGGRGVEMYEDVSRAYVHHNYFYNCLGILEAGATTPITIYDIKVSYNLSIECGRFSGINNAVGDYQVTPSNFQVLNNTIVHTDACTIPLKYAELVFDAVGSAGQYIFRNNIVWMDGWNQVAQNWTTFDHDHNLFYILNPTGPGFNLTPESPDLRENPDLVNVGGTTAEDYKLTAVSPCINAGVDVGLTEDYEGTGVPQGATPDIGTYEYQAILTAVTIFFGCNF